MVTTSGQVMTKTQLTCKICKIIFWEKPCDDLSYLIRVCMFFFVNITMGWTCQNFPLLKSCPLLCWKTAHWSICFVFRLLTSEQTSIFRKWYCGIGNRMETNMLEIRIYRERRSLGTFLNVPVPFPQLKVWREHIRISFQTMHLEFRFDTICQSPGHSCVDHGSVVALLCIMTHNSLWNGTVQTNANGGVDHS